MKPIKALEVGPLPSAGYFTGDEVPSAPSWGYREISPSYVRGNYAVYEMAPHSRACRRRASPHTCC